MGHRVVSLAPSATSTLESIGRADDIVGHTHHDAVGATEVGGWLTPDLDAVAALDPDVVLTTDDLQREIVVRLDERGLETAHFSPQTIDDIPTYIRELGDIIGATAEANRVIESFTRRLERVEAAVAGRDRPVVYCEEWQDPPMVAGNWVPELVEIAGGQYPFLTPGERSRRISDREIESHDPDYVVLNVCGFGEDVDPSSVYDREWPIPAIEHGRVAVIDDALMNQPSPQIVSGIERLAALLHPTAIDG